MTLPENMKFPSNHTATHFHIYDPSGHVVANAVVSPKSTGGGTIKVTFTDYVDNRYNIKGSVRLQAWFANIQYDKKNSFSTIVGKHVVTKELNVTGPKGIKDEFIDKWGSTIEENENEARWTIRIHHMKTEMGETIITDQLSEDNNQLEDMHFIPNSFVFKEVEYHENGGIIRVVREIPLKDIITFSDNNTKFTIQAGNLGNKQYRLEYRTTYKAGKILRNTVRVTSTHKTLQKTTTFKHASSSGEGSGDLMNSKIKIIKVDSENNKILLKEAIFTITRLSDGQTFTLKTDHNGEAISDKLVAGKYTIKEVTAPEGYELNDKVLEVTVSTGEATIQTITNKPIKTSVKVSKKWIGKAIESVKVILLANGKETNQSVILNQTNQWTHTFDNLRQYQSDGSIINYTLKEEVPHNYESKITGNMREGYTITNINKEEISIPVTKQWVGQPRDQVKVKLMADNQEVDSIILNKENKWKHEFKNLRKHNAQDGHEIQYSVKEEKIEGYHSVITGTAENGFIITNTITGKVSVPVTKKWIGAPEESIIVNLYADGEKIDSQKLSKENRWQYTFTQLEKYQNGKEINYTIDEESTKKYKTEITGNISEGFIITNTNIDTIMIPVEKRWVGKKLKNVTIKLLSDHKEIDSIQLSDSNDWKYTFKDLPQYDAQDGHEIIYTILEENIDGYHSTITKDKLGHYVVTNTEVPTSVPQTGDNAHLISYLLLMIISLFTIMGLLMKVNA